MAMHEMLEKKITEIENEILECKKIIEHEQNTIDGKITDDEKFFMECIFGSMENLRKISAEVIADQKEKIESLEKRLLYFKGMRQEEKCLE